MQVTTQFRSLIPVEFADLRAFGQLVHAFDITRLEGE